MRTLERIDITGSDMESDTDLEVAKVRVLPDGRMTRQNAARYLGRKPKTLAMWAVQGKGPRMTKVMGRCFYYKAVLDAFVRGEC